MSRRSPNCWRWRPNGATASRGGGHECARPDLEAFFTERLISQRHASPHTVAAYRDAWRLLLRFIHARTGKAPAQLDLADLGAPVISAFLEHLEQERRNSARTRNARLAAIHSFFHYAALRHPEHAGLIAQVLAIPPKRCPRTEVSYLTGPNLTPWWPHPTRATGSAGEITPCSRWQPRPAFGSQS